MKSSIRFGYLHQKLPFQNFGKKLAVVPIIPLGTVWGNMQQQYSAAF